MNLGRMMIVAGVLLLIGGAIILALGRFGLPPGELPGDIAYRGRNSSFFFPLGTCLVLSIVLSLVRTW